MKTTRKFTALVAVITLLLALWAPMAVVAAPAETAVAAPAVRAVADPLEAPLELLARLDNGDKLCAVYRLILDAVKTGTDYIHFDDYTLSEEEQQILQSVVDATLPENYGNNVGHSYCSVGETYFFNYFYTWDMTEEHKQQTNQQIDALTADLTGKSDFEKSVILYERLAQVNRYDYGTYHQTAYGALVEGMSVCAGYARAYQALLQAVGIPCLYVSGLADNGYEIGGHAWNVVQLDGKWYYADPTWDDHDSVDLPMDYSYFNITYDEISVDHFLDAVYELWVPKEPNTDANYYVHEGLQVESLTVDQLIALFRKHNPLTLQPIGDRATDAQAIIDVFYSNFDAIATALGTPDATPRCISYGDYSLIILELKLVPDHQHDYFCMITDPTCTLYGEISYMCKLCSHVESSLIDPLGHDMVSYPAKEAGCIELGWDAYEECTRCGENNRVEFYGECHYEVSEVVEPTCTDWGWTVYACIYCNGCYNDAFVEPLGHDLEETLSYNENGHGNLCHTCNKLLNFERHGSSCDVCGYGKILGDANGDGKVNNRDLGVLQKHLNGSSVTIDLTAADLDGNGKINNRDLGMLQKLLNA